MYITLAEPFSKPNEIAVLQYLRQYCIASIGRLDTVSSMDTDRQLVSSSSKDKATPDSSSRSSSRRALLARLRMQVV